MACRASRRRGTVGVRIVGTRDRAPGHASVAALGIAPGDGRVSHVAARQLKHRAGSHSEQPLATLRTIASNTRHHVAGRRVVITPSTSAVAVCRSSDSFVSFNSLTFSIAITA